MGIFFLELVGARQRAKKYKSAGQLCLLLRLSTEQAPSYSLAQYWTSPRRTDQPTSALSVDSKPTARCCMATHALCNVMDTEFDFLNKFGQQPTQT